MRKNIKRKVKKINLKTLLFLVFLVTLICLMIHPIELIKNNILKPMSEAVGSNETRQRRYSETEPERATHIDAAGHEYSIEFEQNLPVETLLSYEDIIVHKAQVVSNGKSAISGENKDLYIAEMKSIPNLNYERRYRNQYEWKETISDDILEIAKEDSTITKTENSRMEELWGVLKLGKYFEIYNKEQIFSNSQSIFNIGQTYATTRTLALYKRNEKTLTVGNGLTAAEAYIMASSRNQSTSLDIDKNQQALWVIKDYVSDTEEIPSEYKGLNPEAAIVGANVGEEAKALKKHTAEIEKFKDEHIVDDMETEIYDNMLDTYDTKTKENYYESGMAGLVAYEEATKEFLVGPFSIDYVRTVYIPKVGGQNENQNEEGTIVFNSIIDAEVYGINTDGKEVKLNDWEFVYPDVKYDSKTGIATRTAETYAHENGDTTPNIYPYPNENFYIRFNDNSIQAITKFEYRTSSINAEAEAYLYEGQYYNVSWIGATRNGNANYLQMTPSWTDIRKNNMIGHASADLYQVKTARIVVEEKTITLSVGKYHDKYKAYCIPLTMELGGTVWYDGTEIEAEKTKKVFGVRDKNEKGEYIENGMENIYVHLYDENNKKIASTVTDKNGKYLFDYVKVGQKYYIEFEYDGMKYKATTYLNGDLDNSNYQDSSEFLNYLDYSHTKESISERTEYNNSFTEIKNGDSRTSGQAVSDTGNIKNISYTTESFSETYLGSTADIDRYNFSARTKTTGLIYPLQESYVITNNDISRVDKNQEYYKKLGVKNIFVLGTIDLAKNENFIVKTEQGEANKNIENKKNFKTEQTINYTMIDTYMHNINLGLVERAPLDLAVKNDVVQTMLTLMNNEPEVNILDFGKRDVSKDSFVIENRIDNETSTYFGDVYSQDIPYATYTTKHDMTTNKYSLENDNAQLYVQYKMIVRNQAEVTSGQVTELVNYYENDLYYPVDSNEMWRYYDKNTNYVDISEEEIEKGGKGYGYMVIPQLADYTSWAVKVAKDGSKTELGQIKWASKSKFNNNTKNLSSEGLNTMYTNSLQDVVLGPDERIDIYVIYKVEVKENSSIPNGYGKYISNDNASVGKRNIVEINAYKSLNIDGSNGGRVDKDSAPGNSEINNFITYEDDVDFAPYFRVLSNADEEQNAIIGYVWEDETDEVSTGGYTVNLGNKLINDQIVGNGKIDINEITGRSFEDYINNVKVELIRLEYNPTNGKYEEVQFTEKYTNFYPNIVTSRTDENPYAVICWTGTSQKNGEVSTPLEPGQYRFDNLISGGKYKVRFTYGTEEELRTRFNNLSSTNSSKTIYNGHDYKSTTYNGRMDVSKITNPSTEVYFVVDSYEIAKKKSNGETDIPIINVLKGLNSSLKLENSKISTKIISFGAEDYKVCANFDEIGLVKGGSTVYSALNGVFIAGSNLLENKSIKNKVIVIYNDGEDSRIADVQTQIAKFLKQGITVIGIGNGSESLEIYKAAIDTEKVSVHSITSNKESNNLLKNSICEEILNAIKEEHYFADNISHAEDWLKDGSYSTMNGQTRTVEGRLNVMQYSKDKDTQIMTSAIADTLNIEYIRTLKRDLGKDSELTKAIKTLATNTQMNADSYEVSFVGSEYDTKTLNLGLQEIPEREIEVTNQVDNITIRLADGTKIIDLKQGASQNVQEIPNKLFSIYMDEEIMQGATVEVTYRINISNIGEVDSLYAYLKDATDEEKIDFYKKLTGNTVTNNIDDLILKTETFKISRLYSYFDDLIFRAEDNNKWEIVNKTVLEDENDEYQVKRDSNGILQFVNEDSVYEDRNSLRNTSVVWTEVKDSKVIDRNKAQAEKYSIVETTSLKDIELYPNISKEVRETLDSTSNEKPISTVCTYLVLSKTLSAEDMNEKDALDFKNFVEIIETSSNTGRRDYNGAEGNFAGTGEDIVDENDIDDAERITIMPPFGDKKIMIGLIISSMIILGTGVIFIKKKVL